jgi:two-component system, NtrC family, response regulator PilR
MAGERILVVDDDLSVREVLGILLTREGYAVRAVASAEAALGAAEAEWPDLVLTDLNMPGLDGLELLRRLKAAGARAGRDVQVVVVTAYGTTHSAVDAMRQGASDYVLKPFDNEELRIVVRKALATGAMERENSRLRLALNTRAEYQRFHVGGLVGSSPAMAQVYELVRRIKDSRINCLIQGESGTGKEVVARAIHDSGSRASHPFVAINCGAIPEQLVESELFGHRKGSFTGAIRDKQGLMAAAHKGTLFLDEVASLPLGSQVKLLRAIQERRFTPVGAVEEQEVDVRVVAASNVDLADAVAEGSFREDLFYRLNVVQLDLPPLRERVGDLPELVDHFTAHFAEEYGKEVHGFTPEALRALQQHSFPGNVRELRNLVERAVALAAGPVIGVEDIAGRLRARAGKSASGDGELRFPAEGLNLDALLADTERKWLVAALDACDGNKTEAARLLHMSFRSYRYRLAKHLGGDPD